MFVDTEFEKGSLSDSMITFAPPPTFHAEPAPAPETLTASEPPSAVYVGCKVVRATLMDAVTFEVMNGKRMTGIYHGAQANADGYMVEYEDGYLSWCPKDIFERCYRLVSPGELALLGVRP